MTTSLNISKETLLGLINVLIADKQPSHLRVLMGDLGINWLNPQPLPPKSLDSLDASRSIPAVRTIISLASMAMVGHDEGEELQRSRHMIEAFVEDFCSMAPPRFLLPPPWPRYELKPNALDMIVAAAQFHAAAASLKAHPLNEKLSDAADRLVEAALAKLGRAGVSQS